MHMACILLFYNYNPIKLRLRWKWWQYIPYRPTHLLASGYNPFFFIKILNFNGGNVQTMPANISLFQRIIYDLVLQVRNSESHQLSYFFQMIYLRSWFEFNSNHPF